jgi:hypothetical protein
VATKRNREDMSSCSIGNVYGEATLVGSRDALQGSRQSTIATMASLHVRYYNSQSYHPVQLVIHHQRNLRSNPLHGQTLATRQQWEEEILELDWEFVTKREHGWQRQGGVSRALFCSVFINRERTPDCLSFIFTIMLSGLL